MRVTMPALFLWNARNAQLLTFEHIADTFYRDSCLHDGKPCDEKFVTRGRAESVGATQRSRAECGVFACFGGAGKVRYDYRGFSSE
jgi:hypothetical protein